MELERAVASLHTQNENVCRMYEELTGRSLVAVDKHASSHEGRGGTIEATAESIHRHFELARTRLLSQLQRREEELLAQVRAAGERKATAIQERFNDISLDIARSYSAGFHAKQALRQRSKVWLLENDGILLDDLAAQLV